MKAIEFGNELRKLRKKRKMTIRQLELYSGVSNGYLSQLETGKRGIPSPDILKKLHEPLGIEYNDLMKLAGYITDDEDIEEKPKEKTLKEIIKEGNIKYPDDLQIPEDITEKQLEFLEDAFLSALKLIKSQNNENK